MSATIFESDLAWKAENSTNWKTVPTSGFWTTRKVTIAATIATTLAVAALAAILFSPIGPLAGLGLLIVAAFAGKIVGAGALATAILLPAAFVVVPTGLVAGGLAIQKHSNRLEDKLEEIIIATRTIAASQIPKPPENLNDTSTFNPFIKSSHKLAVINKNIEVKVQFTTLVTHKDYNFNNYDLEKLSIFPQNEKKTLLVECSYSSKSKNPNKIKFLLKRV